MEITDKKDAEGYARLPAKVELDNTINAALKRFDERTGCITRSLVVQTETRRVDGGPSSYSITIDSM